ncbi:alpha-tocopherol transfer protein-like isoform X2 [Zophobas morio]
MTLVIPNNKQQIYIRETLNEDLNTRDRDLEAIKTWLRQEPHLPDTWDDICLLNFLRGCSFSIEKCKRKLDMYFTMRAAVPEFFTNRTIMNPGIKDVIEKTNMICLPGLTPDCKRVNIACNALAYESISFADATKLITMIGDARLLLEEHGVSGDVYILDAELQLLKPFIKNSPILFKKFFICVQEAYPVKIKEIHIINPNSFATIILNAVRPFLSEKIRNRIHIHHTMDTLYKFVPKSMLPDEYGGTAGKLRDLKENWLEKVNEFKEWFKEQEHVVANESRRIGHPLNSEDLFGIEGSFRQLTID